MENAEHPITSVPDALETEENGPSVDPSEQDSVPRKPPFKGRRKKIRVLLRWTSILWKRHWFYLICQAASLGCWLWWLQKGHLPLPGYAIAIVAGLAAIMSVHPDPRPWQKFVYLLLIGGFLVTEFRAIRKDHDDSDTKQTAFFLEQQKGFKSISDESQKNFEETNKEAQKSFASIAQGLQNSYLQSQRQFDATMGGISDEIKTYTGGTSYLVLHYVPGQSFLEFEHKGDHAVFDTVARIVDLDGPRDLRGNSVVVGEVTRGHAALRPVPPQLDIRKDQINLNVFFNARNGDWTEQFRARRIKSGWAVAVMIEGAFSSEKTASVVCTTITKDFPAETLDKEFSERYAKLPNPKPPPCE